MRPGPSSWTDAVLDDWDQLRRAGVSRADAAARIGIRLESLERMLQRHRDDPRAQLGVRRGGPQRWNQWRPRDAYGRWRAAA